MSYFQIEAWLASQSLRAENALLHYLDSESSTPEQLHKAMRYAVLGGGKRIRPLLVYAASELRPKEMLDQALVDTAAVAIEMIHAYSLVHDDLPCMDDDDLRRGRPTVHKAFDEATALLVGDALQTRAFEILSNHQESNSPQTIAIRLAMIEALALASGSKGMAGGKPLTCSTLAKKWIYPHWNKCMR
jgi:farnesyl diphosphate synthase